MKIKRKSKLNIHFNDENLMISENKAEATFPIRWEKVANPKDVLNDFKCSTKNKVKNIKQIGQEISQKITGNITENGISSKSNASLMKELQIKLTRCDNYLKPKNFECCNESNVLSGSFNFLKQVTELNPRSKTGGKKLSGQTNNIEATVNAQKDRKELCNSSNDKNVRELDKIKPKSRISGKKLEKNSGESSKGMINITKETGILQFEGNSNECITKKLLVSLDRYENLETVQLCDDSELSIDVTEKVNSVPNRTGKGQKRKREAHKNDDVKPTKVGKKEKDSEKSKSSREKIPDVTSVDFNNNSKSPSGNEWNFKISSWNVNGIRAWLEKNGLSYLHHEKPDIMCIQETKCSDDKLPEEIKEVEGYHAYWLSGDKEGYSGVALLSKQKPIKIEYGIGISEHDNEGRVITAEYEKFYLVAAYVPNAGRKLVRLEYRMKWDEDFRAYLKKLDAEKPVILCGDLNVAHEEIDLANPKTNKKNAGFTKEEREGFTALLKEGFMDTFRHLYPNETKAYTFWTYMMNARAKNVGWRLDYFVISERFHENLCDSVIRKDVFGSDHCPITLFLSL